MIVCIIGHGAYVFVRHLGLDASPGLWRCMINTLSTSVRIDVCLVINYNIVLRL